MARKSLQDLSGIANTIARSGAKSGERTARPGAPALGALQGSLAAIREIDPGLIDDWGPVDRLGEFTAVNSDEEGEGYDALRESIREGGQQVPILVRRSKDGRYETIYGRRRLQACRDLGIKVRANVQDLDDATALLAKGLENAARRNLTFYEKARFAEAIQAAGHPTATVRQVLNLSASGLSHLMKVSQNVPNQIGDLIGAAPKSGRPKWTALAEMFASRKLTERAAKDILSKMDASLGSDERLDRLQHEASKRGTRQGPTPTESMPVEGVTIRTGRGSVALSAKKSGPNAAFAVWLEHNLDDIITRCYADFTAVKSE